MGDVSLTTKTGILPDGTDISTLSLVERYALILNAGVDMISCSVGVPCTDVTDETYTSIPLSTETIDTYRRPEIIAMEEELMVKSTILLKDDGILPLQKGIKVYFDSNNESVRENTPAALAEFCTVVDSMADADVCVFQVTSFDESYEYMIEDANAAEKSFVTMIQATNSTGEPTAEQLLAANAFAQLTYINTPDHGSSVGSFYRYVKPAIVGQMLFGDKEPAGSTLFEVAYNPEDKDISWGELQDDIGVDNKTCMYMAVTAPSL